MATLVEDKGGNFLVAFRWAGKQYTRSLDTRDQALAEAGVRRVEETIMRLKRGWATMPADAEPGIYITSGGTLAGKPTPKEAIRAVTLEGLFDLFVAGVKKDPKTMQTIRIHHGHVKRLLGPEKAVESVSQADVQGYCDRRSSETHHGRPIRPYTIRKELRTFRQAWKWGHGLGHLEAAPTWTLESLDLERDAGREPFRTFEEIQRRIGRGGLGQAEVDRLWECLYLKGGEVRSCLEYVEARGTARFVYPMLAFVALTGCRRSEMLRSLIDDIDFEGRIVHIRERKRDTSKKFTIRPVDLHPTLAGVLSEWLRDHPGGQHTFCQDDGRPLTEHAATDHLNRSLQGDELWGRIPGFHTFRHSFASILASKGVDQRVIDSLMGHQTEDMRKRYQHLFPQTKRRAVDHLLE